MVRSDKGTVTIFDMEKIIEDKPPEKIAIDINKAKSALINLTSALSDLISR